MLEAVSLGPGPCVETNKRDVVTNPAGGGKAQNSTPTCSQDSKEMLTFIAKKKKKKDKSNMNLIGTASIQLHRTGHILWLCH